LAWHRNCTCAWFWQSSFSNPTKMLDSAKLIAKKTLTSFGKQDTQIYQEEIYCFPFYSLRRVLWTLCMCSEHLWPYLGPSKHEGFCANRSWSVSRMGILYVWRSHRN
jgi:hypothetical protein